MDSTLKQRLIGAVVLVALAVIFLPMLIRGPAPDSGVSNVSLDVPATPAGDYETRELPLVAPGQAPSGGAVGMQGREPAALPGGAPAPTAPAAAGSAAMLPAATAAGAYAVSFGAYATIDDADTVIERLEQARLPGYREPTTINNAVAYRVRIGPFADRADAEAARLQASRIRADVRAQVLALDVRTPASAAPPAPASGAVASEPLPPASSPDAAELRDAPARPQPAAPVAATAAPPPRTTPTPTPAAATAPAPAPARPPTTVASGPAAAGVGFAVQLGAFSSAADADALRDKLRAAGFSAFVQPVQTDKGTLNRVRVGPVSSRDDADQLRAQVASQAGISGLVIPHP